MKKNRTALKEYFQKGAIPTADNFADLIDSMLNQEEDNISKEANAPLKVLATGVEEALINFYRSENSEQKLSWLVKQKFDSKLGLSIGDTATTNRFFIENGSGNIGINTTTPKAKLQVVGAQDLVALRVGTGDASGADFTVDVTGGQGLVSLVAGAKIKPDGGGYTFLGTRGASRINLHDGAINFYTSDATSGTANADAAGLAMGSAKMVLTNTGNLGIGLGSATPNFKLHIKGSTSTNAELRLEPSKWSAAGDYGQISFGDATHYIRGEFTNGMKFYDANKFIFEGSNVGIGVAPSFKLHIKGSTSTDAELRLDPSKWSAAGDYGQISFGDANHYIRGEYSNGMKFYDNNKFVFDGANVGIGTGTAALTRKLEVSGTVRISSVTASDVALSLGGNGDFQIDAAGVLAGRFVVKDSGNVGIGIPGPGEKLEVNGTIKFGSADGWRLDTGSWQGANIRYNAGADDTTNSATFGFHGSGNRTLNLRVDGNSYVDGSLGVGTTTPNYKLEVAGDISVGIRTAPAVRTDEKTGYGAKLCLNGVTENTDPLWMARYNEDYNKTYLRINLGDDNSSDDQLQIGYSSGTWNTALSVDASGNAKLAGKLEVKGDLNITGAQNIFKVVTITKAVKNGGKDNVGTWSVDYTNTKFTEVYTVFVVMQGYSLWDYNTKTEFAIDSKHHVKSTDAIPQHVFVRVTTSDTTKASGTCYCSESDVDGETDNTVLFTVVVMGRI